MSWYKSNECVEQSKEKYFPQTRAEFGDKWKQREYGTDMLVEPRVKWRIFSPKQSK